VLVECIHHRNRLDTEALLDRRFAGDAVNDYGETHDLAERPLREDRHHRKDGDRDTRATDDPGAALGTL
jgi:hypothetical protein